MWGICFWDIKLGRVCGDGHCGTEYFSFLALILTLATQAI